MSNVVIGVKVDFGLPEPLKFEASLSYDEIWYMTAGDIFGDASGIEIESVCWNDVAAVSIPASSDEWYNTSLMKKLQSDERTHFWSKANSYERTEEIVRLREIYCNPNTPPKEREGALYQVYTIFYAFIHSLITKYCGSYITKGVCDREDFTMAALMAVSTNLKNFSPGDRVGGIMASTYFFPYIKHSLISTIAAGNGLSDYYNEIFTKTSRIVAALQAEGKTDIKVADVAARLPKVSTKAIEFCLNKLNASFCVLDEVYNIKSDGDSPDEIAEAEERKAIVRSAIEKLEPEQAKAIKAYYGIPNGVKHTPSEIAAIIGIPPEMVKKLLKAGEKELAKTLSVKGFGVNSK